MIDVVERTADQVFIPLTVGGGIRSTDDMKQILRAGADKVSLNTAAIARPELISEGADIFGRQCIVVAIDARRNEDGSGWGVYTHGGRKPAGLDAVAWAARAAGELGAGELPRHVDGSRWRKEGYDLELLEAIGRAVSVPVIASGGAGNLDHMVGVGPWSRRCSARRVDLPLRRVPDSRRPPAPASGRPSHAPGAGRRPGVSITDLFDWDSWPLIPAVVQDPASLQVLMVGFMNREASKRPPLPDVSPFSAGVATRSGRKAKPRAMS
ncbi:MAG: HisA/HisF-related TIM barrel protein [Thermomicrobiales bacterium]